MEKYVTLDRLDKRIIEELQVDSALSHAELADRVGSTAPSCWRRVRRLEEEGVFTATVRLVDQERVGRGVNVFCNVRLKDFSSESIASFEQFARDEARIMECYRLSGDWDYLIRVVARDVTDYDEFRMQTLGKLPSVATASSNFAMSVTKRKTAVPIDPKSG